ncbi:MAG: hypothetical protein IH988_11270 [Planctomycetes bacterium]|nr:hypothetical protein [Planctomycetota bacterium]
MRGIDMLYVTVTFWLYVVVLSAWGVHALWSGMIKPRAVNIVLLPGTLVAQLGHVLGLLVTGATVTNTTLYKDDESGEPQTTQDAKPRVPVLGPIVIGMLPLLACGLAVFLLAHYMGGGFVVGLTEQHVANPLPTTLAGFWDLLHHQITMVEAVVNATLQSDLRSWQVWIFLYLLVCLTVRMAPFPGHIRGALGAILMLGVLLGLIGMISGRAVNAVQNSWPVLSLTVATLTFLLLISLLIRGVVGLVRILATSR